MTAHPPIQSSSSPRVVTRFISYRHVHQDSAEHLYSVHLVETHTEANFSDEAIFNSNGSSSSPH